MEYSNSARDYAYLVRELSERMGSPNRIEYLKLHNETEAARMRQTWRDWSTKSTGLSTDVFRQPPKVDQPRFSALPDGSPPSVQLQHNEMPSLVATGPVG